VNNWEIVADNLSKAGWSWAWVSALDVEGRMIWIADAHRGDGKQRQAKTISSNRADWAHRGFMQMIRVVTGIRSMPVMRIV
jgi:hypothetical protein